MRAVVDASVMISRFRQDDAHHRASQAWLKRFVERGGTIVLPGLALVEVAGAIARLASDSEQGIRAVKDIMRLPSLRVVPLSNRGTIEAFAIAARLRLRGADAVYVSLSLAARCPLVTLDQQQADRARSAVAIVTPGVG